MTTSLRIASFNNLPRMFELVRGWARQAGHEIVLEVTTPGPRSRRSEGYKQIAAAAGENNIEVLVSTRMKTVVTPVLRELKPDLILSFTFPWLLPPELLQTARLGAVNAHPTVLPAFRGPNPLRQFYHGAARIGATLHWTEAEFDTGNILSQHSVPMPNPCLPEMLLPAWGPTMMMVLSEGVPRAIAGDKGTPQPSEGVSYAGEFTDADRWLDADDTAYALQCKVTALGMVGPPTAKMRIQGEDWLLARVTQMPGSGMRAAVGSVLETTKDGLVLQVADGAVTLTATRMA